MNDAQMKAMIAKLQAENEALKLAQPACSLKISEKGCITLTGVRPPYGISLYPGEWDTVLSQKDNIQAFAEANREELTRRGKATRQAKAAEKALGVATPADRAQITAWQASRLPDGPPPADAPMDKQLAYYKGLAKA